jgi:hypothetical protein
VIASETDHWVENLTGLAGSGAHLALTVVRDHAQQGHPLIPVIQVAEADQRGRVAAEDIDAFLSGDPSVDLEKLTQLVAATASHRTRPAANAHGFVDFQLTRGLLGLTT